MKTGLENKHVLITGSAGGIGRSLIVLFIKEGANVTTHYNKNKIDLAVFTEGEISRIHLIQADFKEEDEIEKLFTRAVEKFGRIDALVCNAGIWPVDDIGIQDMSLNRWNKTLQINLTGYFLAIKYFFKNLNTLKEDYASIVMVGSTSGVFGEAYHVDYSVSKSGLIGLMLSAKNEIGNLARKGRVNIISPGWTKTPMAEQFLEDHNLVKKVLQTTSLRKIALAEDIANQIMAISSPIISGHVTGQHIVVAGGMEGRILFQKEEIDVDRKFG